MKKVELPIHRHPLLSFTRFAYEKCFGCESKIYKDGYIYGGYRCNELGCDQVVFHKECAEFLREINHSSHPDHPPLKLRLPREESDCSRCGKWFINGYFCSICDFKLDLKCAGGQAPPLVLESSNVHEHRLEVFQGKDPGGAKMCQVCNNHLNRRAPSYKCDQCKFFFDGDCASFFPEAKHTSHPQHPLKLLTCEAPDYADKKCLLCGADFDGQLHHCDVCNFSICRGCMKNPPPLVVVSVTTHDHQLHLVARRINFTCNACGTQGDRSPYFCLQCNFMIHWDCIDLPRVININRHDHRISYTRRLGHGNWKCGVCRKKVDGFYGAYSCTKCSNYVVHSRCATRKDVWDMVELEGTREEEDIPPFEVVDENTIKHFSHDHNLRINKDGQSLHENTLCQGCVFQICSETFYKCEQCDYILHQKCANIPRKKRHMCYNQRFALHTDVLPRSLRCHLCRKYFNGFRFQSGSLALDTRCGSIAEPFEHESHPHPLFYNSKIPKTCTICGTLGTIGHLSCDECVSFTMCFTCGVLPRKVMRHRYDDHPLFLSYGESSVDGEYWCEACETKVNPKKWFYTCNDCGIILHISCVVGDFSDVMPGSAYLWGGAKVVTNTSICRPVCIVCNSRCKLPSILQVSKADKVVYICSYKCLCGLKTAMV